MPAPHALTCSAPAHGPADPVERVCGATAVTVGVLLHAAAHSVHAGEPELDHVEAVQDPDRVRQGRRQGGGVATEGVERG